MQTYLASGVIRTDIVAEWHRSMKNSHTPCERNDGAVSCPGTRCRHSFPVEGWCHICTYKASLSVLSVCLMMSECFYISPRLHVRKHPDRSMPNARVAIHGARSCTCYDRSYVILR